MVQKSEARIILYDFKRPDKFSLPQIRSLYIIHEQFCRLLAAHWSTRLKMEVEVEMQKVDQMCFSEFTASMPTPAVSAVLGMQPIRSTAALELDPGIAKVILDKLFGGGGDGYGGKRKLTPVETFMMQDTVNQLLPCLSEAWECLLPLQPSCMGIETSAEHLQILPPEEMIILVTAECRMAEQKGNIELCLPYLLLEPLLEKLNPQYWYSQVKAKKGRGSLSGYIPSLALESKIFYESPPMPLGEIDEVLKGKALEIPMDSWKCLLEAGGEVLFELEPLDVNTFSIRKDTGLEEGLQEIKQTSSSIQKSIEDSLQKYLGPIQEKLEYRLNALEEKTNLWDRPPTLLPLRESFVSAVEEEYQPFRFITAERAKNLFFILRAESSQLIALVLSYLDASIAAVILEQLSDKQQLKVIQRISRLDEVSPEVLKELEVFLSESLGKFKGDISYKTGGINSAVDILNCCESSVEKYVIQSLEQQEPKLAESLKQNMFVFEDCVFLDPRDLGLVFERVDRQDLLLALRMVDEAIKTEILSLFNDQDRIEIENQLREMRRVRLTQVEEAQNKIVNTIRIMEENGEIIVAHPDELV